MSNSIENGFAYVREKLGLSQYAAAVASGLSANDVCRIEHGKFGTSVRKAERLAECYHIPLDPMVKNQQDILDLLLHALNHAEKSMIKAPRMITQDVGGRGEDYDLLEEQKKLQGTLYADKVDNSYAQNPDAHFDLLSYDRETGAPVYVEVKTTIHNGKENFSVSPTELDFMQACLKRGNRYEIHRVFLTKDLKYRKRIVYSAQELIRDYRIEPTGFRFVKEVCRV